MPNTFQMRWKVPMKRISFACLFLCLTTSFLLPQTNPVPLRHGRAGRHSGLGVRPDSTFTTQVGGSIDCISDENVLINVSAGDMWAYATPPYEEIGTYPNAPVSGGLVWQQFFSKS